MVGLARLIPWFCPRRKTEAAPFAFPNSSSWIARSIVRTGAMTAQRRRPPDSAVRSAAQRL